MDSIKVVYKLGKIYNKHLILDIFAFSGERKHMFRFIHGINRDMRKMLRKNMIIASTIFKNEEPIDFILGKESFDPEFFETISETSLFQTSAINQLKKLRLSAKFMRYETV